MRVIVAGSRRFWDYKYIFRALDEKLPEGTTEIVSGHALGVDTAGELYAKQRGIPLKIFAAKWDVYGKSAGPIRNREMAKYADALIAFYGGTRGTENMIAEMRRQNKKVIVVAVPR